MKRSRAIVAGLILVTVGAGLFSRSGDGAQNPDLTTGYNPRGEAIMIDEPLQDPANPIVHGEPPQTLEEIAASARVGAENQTPTRGDAPAVTVDGVTPSPDGLIEMVATYTPPPSEHPR